MNVVCLSVMLFVISIPTVRIDANEYDDGHALFAFKQAITDDPDNVLYEWDNTSSPCKWRQISCENINNNVIAVDLGGGGLSGHLVPELGNLEKLQRLELYNNSLDVTIPAELGNLKNLISLDLYNNRLTGPIPETLGNLPNLMFLRLDDNNLSGRIPVQALLPVAKRNGSVVDLSNNTDLCSNYTVPPCPP